MEMREIYGQFLERCLNDNQITIEQFKELIAEFTIIKDALKVDKSTRLKNGPINNFLIKKDDPNYLQIKRDVCQGIRKTFNGNFL